MGFIGLSDLLETFWKIVLKTNVSLYKVKQ